MLLLLFELLLQILFILDTSGGHLFDNGHYQQSTHTALGLSKSANQIIEINNKVGEKGIKLNEQLNNNLSRKGLGIDGKFKQGLEPVRKLLPLKPLLSNFADK